LNDDAQESQFKQWLADHVGSVLKIARAYTVTPEDAQDLVQEILLQVWRSFPQFEGRSSPATWFYRVALNTALGWKRNEHRRRTHHCPIVELDDPPAAGSDSAEQAAQRELLERLYAAIRRLPATDAALILLHLEELSYAEIAEVLGISESNVGVKLTRTRQRLADEMNGRPDAP
jgi:RNA polymerase sigma-70 factor (ECF subfamily)